MTLQDAILRSGEEQPDVKQKEFNGVIVGNADGATVIQFTLADHGPVQFLVVGNDVTPRQP